MKRSVLVAAGTAVGVTAVVSYHAASPSGAAGLASTSTSSAARSTTTATGSASKSRTASHASSHSAARASTTSSSTTAAAKASTRSAVGEAVSYQYGELQVKVTERGGRITNVSVARLEVGDPHSESVDEYAIPRLRQEVLSAQSGRIDGVSGASYTSQAYETSVQSALDRLA